MDLVSGSFLFHLNDETVDLVITSFPNSRTTGIRDFIIGMGVVLRNWELVRELLGVITAADTKIYAGWSLFNMVPV